MRQPACILAVSYTHLDVYKRQAQGKSGPKARTRVVVDGQLVEIPVLCIIRTVGTQEDRWTAEREDAAKYKVKLGRQIRRMMMKYDGD